jgi:Protein of unknown function (DUF2510)
LTEKQSRKNRKNLAKAQKIIGPSTDVAAYGSGAGKARITQGFIILVLCCLALSLLVYLNSGIVLIPGLLPIIIGASLVRPRRGVAVTPGGLIVMHESNLDASPNRILVGAPLDALDAHVQDADGSVQTSVDLEVGTERIRLKRAAFETLVLARNELPVGDPHAGSWTETLPTPGWFPDPSGRNEFRYWNGGVWTHHVSTGGFTSCEPG